jgi:hypothetical protein
VIEEVTEAETTLESPVQELKAVVEEVVVIEVTEAETTLKSPVKEEPESVVEAVVTEEVTKAQAAPENHQSKKN